LKATKIGEIRRLSADEISDVAEEILNQERDMTWEEVDTRRPEIEDMFVYPRDYKITWASKVSKSLQNFEGNGAALSGGFTYELEKATQQQPTLITILEKPFWLYQNSIYRAPLDLESEEILLFIKEQEIKKTRRLERLRKLVEVSETLEKASSRERIPDEVRMVVYERDKGKCVECGSQENLEYDHLLPFSKGGATSVNNIQLLCLACNRSKSDKI